MLFALVVEDVQFPFIDGKLYPLVDSDISGF